MAPPTPPREPPRGQVISLFGDRSGGAERGGEDPEEDSGPVEPFTVGQLPSELTTPAPGPLNDRRQRRAAGTLRKLRAQLGGMVPADTNIEAGYPASSVDLGRLQEMLERSLSGLDMVGVRHRWDEDVEEFLLRTVRAHVQRVKELSVDCRETGIHISFRTQDDLGYYRYAFDVFPVREPS